MAKSYSKNPETGHLSIWPKNWPVDIGQQSIEFYHHAELAAEAKQWRWNTKVNPAEVGLRGFVASSTVRLLREPGIQGQALWQSIRAVPEVAERSSHWTWIKQKGQMRA